MLKGLFHDNCARIFLAADRGNVNIVRSFCQFWNKFSFFTTVRKKLFLWRIRCVILIYFHFVAKMFLSTPMRAVFCWTFITMEYDNYIGGLDFWLIVRTNQWYPPIYYVFPSCSEVITNPYQQWRYQYFALDCLLERHYPSNIFVQKLLCSLQTSSDPFQKNKILVLVSFRDVSDLFVSYFLFRWNVSMHWQG